MNSLHWSVIQASSTKNWIFDLFICFQSCNAPFTSISVRMCLTHFLNPIRFFMSCHNFDHKIQKLYIMILWAGCVQFSCMKMGKRANSGHFSNHYVSVCVEYMFVLYKSIATSWTWNYDTKYHLMPITAAQCWRISLVRSNYLNFLHLMSVTCRGQWFWYRACVCESVCLSSSHSRMDRRTDLNFGMKGTSKAI